MTWEISHSPEAWNDVQFNLEGWTLERLRECVTDLGLIDPDVLPFCSHDALVLRVIESIEEHGLCSNGGHEFYVDPEGYWTVPLRSVPDAFALGYLECAVWADLRDHDGCCPDGEPSDSCSGGDSVDHTLWTHEDMTEQSLREQIGVCRDFQEANRASLDIARNELGRDDGCLGHDFWLTRNGHGTGFWDRGNEPVWGELTAASKPYGSASPEFVDNRDYSGETGWYIQE